MCGDVRSQLGRYFGGCAKAREFCLSGGDDGDEGEGGCELYGEYRGLG